MIGSYISSSDLTTLEPSLSASIGYAFTGESDLTSVVAIAKAELADMLRNMAIDTKQLCSKLTLEDGVTSDEDIAERTRLVINMSAKVSEGAITFTLQGSNNGTTFSTISTNATLSATTLNTDYAFYFTDTYKYYKLTATGSATYTAFLIQQTLEHPHKLLALSHAFKRLSSDPTDVFEQKSVYYRELAVEAIQNIRVWLDTDLDGSLDVNSDSILNPRQARIKR